MRSFILVAVCLAMLLGYVGKVQAHDLFDILFSNCVPNCIKARQCDDYCPKLLPCTKPTCNRQCDDYRAKQRPCTIPTCATVCDDYCAKPLPKVCCCQRTATAMPCEICRRQSGSPEGATIVNNDQSVSRQAVKQARMPKRKARTKEFDYFR